MKQIRFQKIFLAAMVAHHCIGGGFSIQLIQVMEELEDKQLLGRLTMVEQENKELREVKILHSFIFVLDQILHFSHCTAWVIPEIAFELNILSP